ncbi:hypothetical protein DCAR_0831428 [Daucus carota subsp. sativus]|uniref:Uncharacterized protein n=1 Tax=Daucus carota subsp. sativus TaxID=79200 RepID=A0A175YM91_DAUCS|nr:hypothetical protein DCAR_0831428 [Daucus carota subsp. sativus]
MANVNVVRMFSMSSSSGNLSNDAVRRRSIPKRGQVKAGIVLGLAQSVASVFSPRARAKSIF